MLTMTKQQAEIRVVGVVQGIGFRPFIYSLAVKRNLRGYVLNTGNSAVRIVVEGEKDKIIEFIESIKTDKPQLAVIDNISTIWRSASGKYSEFNIRISQNEEQAGGSIIPADIAICKECIEDIMNSVSRHHHYPFTCCAICGPRYTTIVNTPYDRERTTMEEFPLCEDCQREFNNPSDRRYNAQTICCPRCGPQFRLLNQAGKSVEVNDVFVETVKLLNEGFIIAIKGLGGTHIAVRASLEEQIKRLRHLRNKPMKPLAIMSGDLEDIRNYAILTDGAERLLTSWRRPIVVLKKKDPFPLAASLAPGLDTIGAMLPYSGIYERLFNGLDDFALVMTSANPAGLPTIIQSTTFQTQFMQMADYLLTHNRTIHQRCDDSVVIPSNGGSLILRRSRGYTPEPIETATSGPPVLVVGALEKNTGGIYHGRRFFLTQHIGDIDTFETLTFLQESLKHLQELLRVTKYNAIGCDLHPDFLTTEYAETLASEQGVPLIRIQHHHAHLAALMADHQLSSDEDIVAICCDGSGYGADKTTWGGEILVGNASDYRRSGHLRTHPMPGGDLAAKYPLRMLIGILAQKYSKEELYEHFKESAIRILPQGIKELEVVIKQAKQSINTPLTSSTGRVLDALSTLFNVCHERTYEGEPAIRFEAYANKADHKSIKQFTIPQTTKGKTIIIETGALINHMFENYRNHNGSQQAFGAHISLGNALATAAITIAKREGIKRIGFSGGVAYNQILNRTIQDKVQKSGINFLMHKNVPPGDAGTAVGQALITRSKIVY